MFERLTTADIVLIVGLALGSLLMLGINFYRSTEGLSVEIYNADGLYMRLPLEGEQLIRVPGPLGESLVELKDGSVHMQHSPCPQKICVEMGRIDKAGQSVICMPNRVNIRIADKHADSVVY